LARSANLIGPSRERSIYPALWDYYIDLRRKRLRLFDVTAEAIKNELQLIAFSKLTDFIRIPTRADLERQQLYDAKVRESFGVADEQDAKIINDAEEILKRSSARESAESLHQYAPGATVKLKCIEDIPEELLPAIAEISETRDGIKLKLHPKIEALEKLAKILKMYEDEGQADKPTTIENLNIIVNGSKSDLLNGLTAQI